MDKCALYKNQNYDIKVKGSYSAMENGHLKDNALGKYENSSQRHVEEMRLKTKRLYLGEQIFVKRRVASLPSVAHL